MKKLLFIIGIFLFSWEINAAVVPEIWHRPDSLVTTRRSRVQAVEKAQKVVDNYGASTTQAYSSFTSKGTSEFLNKATKQNDNKQVE